MRTYLVFILLFITVIRAASQILPTATKVVPENVRGYRLLFKGDFFVTNDTLFKVDMDSAIVYNNYGRKLLRQYEQGVDANFDLMSRFALMRDSLQSLQDSIKTHFENIFAAQNKAFDGLYTKSQQLNMLVKEANDNTEQALSLVRKTKWISVASGGITGGIAGGLLGGSKSNSIGFSTGWSAVGLIAGALLNWYLID
jgi:ElaB/YqjD/DUF883 family membrane-anchored ribosome-binding protein